MPARYAEHRRKVKGKRLRFTNEAQIYSCMPGPKASVAAYVDKIQRPAMKITTYRLIEDAEGWELTGGRLEKELRYPADAESVQTVKQLVGFLVQYVGGELRIYRAGETVPAEIKIYPRSALPPLNRLGAL